MPLIPEAAPASHVAQQFRRRRPPRAPSGEGVAGAVWCAPTPVTAVLARRRAVRSYAPTPLARGELGAVLAMAEGARRRSWPADPHGDPGLAVYVLARAVAGLPAGMHRARDDSFDPLDDAGPATDTWRVYADAPALLFICGDLAGACAPGGLGHGALLVQAGALGHGIWLAALTRGLACCVYGGTSGAVTAAARSLDPRSRHLFTVSIGHAEIGGDDDDQYRPDR